MARTGRPLSTNGKYINCKECGKSIWVTDHNKRSDRHRVHCSMKCRLETKKRGHLDSHGYRQFRLSGHPLAMASGYVLGHWLTMYEQHPLGPEFVVELKTNGWTIHHLNGNRDDNRYENLEFRATGEHPKGSSIEDMISLLQQFGYKVNKKSI